MPIRNIVNEQNEAITYVIYTTLAIAEIVAAYVAPLYLKGLSPELSPAYALVGEGALIGIVYKLSDKHGNALETAAYALAALASATFGYLIAHETSQHVLGGILGVGGFTIFAAKCGETHMKAVDSGYAAEQDAALELVKARARYDWKRGNREIFTRCPRIARYYCQLVEAFRKGYDYRKILEVFENYPCFVHLVDKKGRSLYECYQHDPILKAILLQFGGDKKLPLDPIQERRMKTRLAASLNENDAYTQDTLAMILNNHPHLSVCVILHPNASRYPIIQERYRQVFKEES